MRIFRLLRKKENYKACTFCIDGKLIPLFFNWITEKDVFTCNKCGERYDEDGKHL